MKTTLRKTLRRLAISLAAIFLLVTVAIGGIVAYLTPQRLTPLVNSLLSEYIHDADIQARRVDISWWSTFPRLHLAVDTLTVTGHLYHSLPDSLTGQLPAGSDTILAIKSISGSLNLPSLLRGNITLSQVLIDNPRCNVFITPDGRSSADIIVPDTTDTPLDLPPISLDRFTIRDAGPLRFTSLRDTVSLVARLDNITLEGHAPTPLYSLTISGSGNSQLLKDFNLDPLTLGIDGNLRWAPSAPYAIDLNDMTVAINDIPLSFSTSLDFAGDPTVNSLSLNVKSLALNTILGHLPDKIRATLPSIDTNLAFSASMQLRAPWILGDSIPLPSFEASLDIPECRLSVDNARLDRLSLSATALIDGVTPSQSTVTLNSLSLDGKAITLDADAVVTDPLGDPHIDGRLASTLRLAHIPPQLLKEVPYSLSGTLDTDTKLQFNLSDITSGHFHRLKADGYLNLSDIDIAARDSSLAVENHKTRIKFSTSKKVLTQQKTLVDSMLTLNINVDTATILIPGYRLTTSNLQARLGTANRHNSTDTTIVNPLGGIIDIASFNIAQPHDSLNVRFGKIHTVASLTRYKGNLRAPQVDFDLTARRISTRIPSFAAFINNPDICVHAHFIPLAPGAPKPRYPRRRHINETDTIRRDDYLDFNLSSGMRRILRRWDIKGHLRSDRGLVFTRAFPLRQRATDIDISFNNDSVILNTLHYSLGNTRFDVSGIISNMQRALTSRNGRQKLKANLEIDAPLIDLNQLARTAFHRSGSTLRIDSDRDAEKAFNARAVVDTADARALIIPRNLDISLLLMGDTVRYGDLTMTDIFGDILVDNSAINMRRLSAVTDIGSATLSALYWAPDTARMQFGMGMELQNFHLHRVRQLIPAIDSLLPAISQFSGIINADLAATSSLTPSMDVRIPTLKAALKLSGDSLVLLDAATFKSLSRWLAFKNKKRNMIDRMTVEFVIDNSQIEIFPFIFDIDRYRVGLMGRNDLNLNLDYHVSVLKSPLPFRFGINIRGPIHKLRYSLGGAKIKPGTVERWNIADTSRINLLNQIQEVFRRGTMSQKTLDMAPPPIMAIDTLASSLSATDSTLMIREGFLPPKDTILPPPTDKKLKKTPK